MAGMERGTGLVICLVVFEYICTSCSLTFRCNVRDDQVMCLRCDRMARRVWGFHLLPSSGAGYNPAVGGHVRNLADVKSRLSQATEEANTPRTIWDAHGEAHTVTPPPARFVPVDLRDREACGATSEGLPATYDALRAQGNDPAADRLRRLID